ncbi:MAG: (d)CMP kinase [Deltaproteobacteria bacterium]|nr:(d)CMP kinase [Deltaproteobacteria bacterium]
MGMIRDVVAIDGPAGSGKSSVSRSVAGRLGYVYLDTGAMYRAVALAAGRMGLDLEDGPGLGGLCRGLDLSFATDGDHARLFLGEEDISDAIRTPEMDMLSSAVSAVPEVRQAMTGLQRRMGETGKVVAEGRDMGTVVFPEARHKFFLTASPAVRAERRYQERVGRGETVSLQRVAEELKRRDRQDESRAVAPLRAAEDALVVDTTDLTLEQVISFIIRTVGRGDDPRPE